MWDNWKQGVKVKGLIEVSNKVMCKGEIWVKWIVSLNDLKTVSHNIYQGSYEERVRISVILQTEIMSKEIKCYLSSQRMRKDMSRQSGNLSILLQAALGLWMRVMMWETRNSVHTSDINNTNDHQVVLKIDMMPPLNSSQRSLWCLRKTNGWNIGRYRQNWI